MKRLCSTIIILVILAGVVLASSAAPPKPALRAQRVGTMLVLTPDLSVNSFSATKFQLPERPSGTGSWGFYPTGLSVTATFKKDTPSGKEICNSNNCQVTYKIKYKRTLFGREKIELVPTGKTSYTFRVTAIDSALPNGQPTRPSQPGDATLARVQYLASSLVFTFDQQKCIKEVKTNKEGVIVNLPLKTQLSADEQELLKNAGVPETSCLNKGVTINTLEPGLTITDTYYFTMLNGEPQLCVAPTRPQAMKSGWLSSGCVRLIVTTSDEGKDDFFMALVQAWKTTAMTVKKESDTTLSMSWTPNNPIKSSGKSYTGARIVIETGNIDPCAIGTETTNENEKKKIYTVEFFDGTNWERRGVKATINSDKSKLTLLWDFENDPLLKEKEGLRTFYKAPNIPSFMIPIFFEGPCDAPATPPTTDGEDYTTPLVRDDYAVKITHGKCELNKECDFTIDVKPNPKVKRRTEVCIVGFTNNKMGLATTSKDLILLKGTDKELTLSNSDPAKKIVAKALTDGKYLRYLVRCDELKNKKLTVTFGKDQPTIDSGTVAIYVYPNSGLRRWKQVTTEVARLYKTAGGEEDKLEAITTPLKDVKWFKSGSLLLDSDDNQDIRPEGSRITFKLTGTAAPKTGDLKKKPDGTIKYCDIDIDGGLNLVYCSDKSRELTKKDSALRVVSLIKGNANEMTIPRSALTNENPNLDPPLVKCTKNNEESTISAFYIDCTENSNYEDNIGKVLSVYAKNYDCTIFSLTLDNKIIANIEHENDKPLEFQLRYNSGEKEPTLEMVDEGTAKKYTYYRLKYDDAPQSFWGAGTLTLDEVSKSGEVRAATTIKDLPPSDESVVEPTVKSDTGEFTDTGRNKRSVEIHYRTKLPILSTTDKKLTIDVPETKKDTVVGMYQENGQGWNIVTKTGERVTGAVKIVSGATLEIIAGPFGLVTGKLVRYATKKQITSGADQVFAKSAVNYLVPYVTIDAEETDEKIITFTQSINDKPTNTNEAKITKKDGTRKVKWKIGKKDDNSATYAYPKSLPANKPLTIVPDNVFSNVNTNVVLHKLTLDTSPLSGMSSSNYVMTIDLLSNNAAQTVSSLYAPPREGIKGLYDQAGNILGFATNTVGMAGDKTGKKPTGGYASSPEIIIQKSYRNTDGVVMYDCTTNRGRKFTINKGETFITLDKKNYNIVSQNGQDILQPYGFTPTPKIPKTSPLEEQLKKPSGTPVKGTVWYAKKTKEIDQIAGSRAFELRAPFSNDEKVFRYVSMFGTAMTDGVEGTWIARKENNYYVLKYNPPSNTPPPQNSGPSVQKGCVVIGNSCKKDPNSESCPNGCRIEANNCRCIIKQKPQEEQQRRVATADDPAYWAAAENS